MLLSLSLQPPIAAWILSILMARKPRAELARIMAGTAGIAAFTVLLLRKI
jgi:hypothetical protein